MATMNDLFDKYPNLTTEEIQIIGYFIAGQNSSISGHSLKIESSMTSLRLMTSQGQLIGISKQTNDWQRKVLVIHNSTYTSSIVELLTDSGFINKQNSSHPDFTEHHYYQVPIGYRLNHTDILKLWKIWWNNKRYQLKAKTVPIDVLIFSKGNWCAVQDFQPDRDNFILRTDRGELKISSEDIIVWIDKIDRPEYRTGSLLEPDNTNVKSSETASAPAPVVKTPSARRLEVTIPGQSTAPTVSVKQPSQPNPAPMLDRLQAKIDLPEPEEDLDLETYLSTFNTEDTEDIDRIEGIYQIEDLLSGTFSQPAVSPPPAPPTPTFKITPKIAVNIQPQTPPVAQQVQPQQPPARLETAPISAPINTNRLNSPSIAQQKHSLKLKALNTLTNYLQNGETITRSVLLTNGQGQTIERKMSTTKRGCPGWTIAQIKQLENELAQL